ncbi:rhodanese-like domain-containing protein [Chloropicon primus]|nr:rhodanese-like domain-containing protein [Chloropicon primus]UPR04705.1 rhodanese-like domain-containing protein [Chloropicon primus]|eukprot:QDZ25508.1 rhodanese-like domain-containing protein [Chloropicon primus]
MSPGGGRLIDGNRPTSPKAWKIQYKALKEKRVREVLGSDIDGLRRRGALLIDVRPSEEYDAGHIEGSLNVPLYKLIDGWSPQQCARKATFAFFGIFNGTEYNDKFESDLQALTDAKDEIVLICSTGGTLNPDQKSQSRAQSRSLMAAYDMIGLGYEKIRFLDGGYNQWRNEEREIVVND